MKTGTRQLHAAARLWALDLGLLVHRSLGEGGCTTAFGLLGLNSAKSWPKIKNIFPASPLPPLAPVKICTPRSIQNYQTNPFAIRQKRLVHQQYATQQNRFRAKNEPNFRAVCDDNNQFTARSIPNAAVAQNRLQSCLIVLKKFIFDLRPSVRRLARLLFESTFRWQKLLPTGKNARRL